MLETTLLFRLAMMNEPAPKRPRVEGWQGSELSNSTVVSTNSQRGMFALHCTPDVPNNF